MIRRFLISIACFALIDAVWLGTIAQPFYQQHLGTLLKPEFSLAPAILFYLIYLCGLNFFVIHPQRNNTYKSFRLVLHLGHAAMRPLI